MTTASYRLTTEEEQLVQSVAQQLASQLHIQPAGLDGWVNSSSRWGQIALHFASHLAGLLGKGRDGTTKLRMLKYLAEWPDRFGVVMDYYIFDPHGRVLVGLRSEKVQHAGKWCFPGGHTEDRFPEEYVGSLANYEALKDYLFSYLRLALEELVDETGLIFTAEELLRSIALPWQFQGNYHLETGKRFFQISFALFPTWEQIEKDIKKSTPEMDELRFVQPQEILSGDSQHPMAFPAIQPPVLAYLTRPGGYVATKLATDAILAKLGRGERLSVTEQQLIRSLRPGL